jgi:xanthine dehydrogenase large subunit
MNYDVIKHVKGESLFIDDFDAPAQTLHAAVFDSPVAHAKIKNIDFTEALATNGVQAVFTYKDIPGINQIGNIIKDETLLAETEVEFIGEPIAIIIADTPEIARKAKNKIKIDLEELPVITDPREAYQKGLLIAPPVTFSAGELKDAFEKCDVTVEGRVDIGGQEHLYLETQGALAIPGENGSIKIYSSTQSPTAVQRAAAGVLDLEMNKVEVDVLRLGGAFGGKEDQATSWAVMAALAAFKLNKPVKLILNRQEDMRMTGKRHPYSADYKIGLSKEGKILAYEVVYYQNSGACADLSSAILERTLFHTTGSYYIPNVKATGYMCKTNLPPNTAFRGFGGPQGMFVIESAIFKAAEKLNMPVHEIQKKNLINEGDTFYYGQKAERVNARKCWDLATEEYGLDKKIKEIKKFNSDNNLVKKGLALMPICFGISFTSSFLNQASALVHVYTDGSVGISTAAVEMGQGVNEKIRTVAAKTLSISIDRIKVETTNTTRVANTSPTAASTGADLNGNATLLACNEILARLKSHAAEILNAENSEDIEIIDEKVFLKGEATEITWESLINSAYLSRIALSEHAYYATPLIHFDRKSNKGRPFAYHVYGTAIIEASVDVLRGTYEIEEVDIVHDFGKSINPNIDIGQTEGAVVQGIGWLTIEELAQDEKGRLLSNSLSTYKIPDIYSSPKKINIKFLEESENPFGPLQSKAIGEPPFMYGIAAYFAILNAVKEVNPNSGGNIKAPLTPERVMMLL